MFFTIKMNPNMRVNGTRTKRMALELLLTPMGIFIKENGNTTKGMEEEYCSMLMAPNMKAIGNTMNKTDLELFMMKKVSYSAPGKITKEMESAGSIRVMEPKRNANGQKTEKYR